MVEKQLEIEKRGAQWRYRVSETFENKTSIRVDWQWGAYDEEETLKQANERFGPFSKVIIED